MKRLPLLILVLGQCVSVLGQGTLEFTADLSPANTVPPSSFVIGGTGTFLLDGLQLDYEIKSDAWMSPIFIARIHGPAEPGENADALYDLGRQLYCVPPLPGHPDFCLWQGEVTIDSDQVQELQEGLWYVELWDYAFTEPVMRGQIVPEPAGWKLAVLTGAIALLLLRAFRKRTMASASRTARARS